ncbi:hypothetical protein I6F35_14690 [Bradyrhizobium sp. BRP22]|uniref:hypothetical protein n=1 Tax=Bradyrhizobium sp. BRP22 TaxID=2793821 RepID=UPI001CD60F05|nr:hypothetical protein [Bradyrhizobium sp. BRP22]MCA1454457.1 hypothetical protein [Bradyrhizobium sp. BRP22]
MINARRSFTQIFLVPAIIAVIVAFGLVSALLGDGIWDTTSWIALGVPLAVTAFFACRAR